MTSGDLAAHIGDAILELTARRKVVERELMASSTHSEAETEAAGRALAGQLRPG